MPTTPHDLCSIDIARYFPGVIFIFCTTLVVQNMEITPGNSWCCCLEEQGVRIFCISPKFHTSGILWNLELTQIIGISETEPAIMDMKRLLPWGNSNTIYTGAWWFVARPLSASRCIHHHGDDVWLNPLHWLWWWCTMTSDVLTARIIHHEWVKFKMISAKLMRIL